MAPDGIHDVIRSKIVPLQTHRAPCGCACGRFPVACRDRARSDGRLARIGGARNGGRPARRGDGKSAIRAWNFLSRFWNARGALQSCLGVARSDGRESSCAGQSCGRVKIARDASHDASPTTDATQKTLKWRREAMETHDTKTFSDRPGQDGSTRASPPPLHVKASEAILSPRSAPDSSSLDALASECAAARSSSLVLSCGGERQEKPVWSAGRTKVGTNTPLASLAPPVSLALPRPRRRTSAIAFSSGACAAANAPRSFADRSTLQELSCKGRHEK